MKKKQKITKLLNARFLLKNFETQVGFNYRGGDLIEECLNILTFVLQSEQQQTNLNEQDEYWLRTGKFKGEE